MYALVALLALVASAAFARAFAWSGRGVGDRLRGGAGRDALHAQLGALLRRRVRARLALPGVRARTAASGARRSCSGRSRSAARSCCTCRGSRPRSTRPPTRARRGRSRRPFVALLETPATMLGQFAQVALLLAAGAGLAVLLQQSRPVAGRVAAGHRAADRRRSPGPSSQLSPAWANRYLAVAAAPLLLAVAAGLAHAGRLGIAGLIVAAVLGAGDTAPDDKSNVREVARDDRAEPARRRPRRSRPSPSRCRCSTTTCPRACASRRSPAR